MSSLFIISVLTFSSLTQPLAGSCQNGWTSGGSLGCLKFYPTPRRTWMESVYFCRQNETGLDSHLAEVNT